MKNKHDNERGAYSNRQQPGEEQVEDTEAHGAKFPLTEDATNEDAEAHGFRMGATADEPAEDTEAHGAISGRLDSDDDVESHGIRGNG